MTLKSNLISFGYGLSFTKFGRMGEENKGKVVPVTGRGGP
jgi:hypothetical protein